ncbi:MAG: hypothetical protein ACFBSC_03660 [Microcoleaceae cyanobacterium]
MSTEQTMPEHASEYYPNVSLAAFYGEKPPEFAALILQVQQQLSTALSDSFQPNPIERVHATLIGCEGINTPQGILSRWFQTRRDEDRSINFSGFLDYVRRTPYFPLQVQLGGYRSETDYGFLSQGSHPFQRSFQFLGNIAVLVGWPFKHQKIPLDLDNFRRDCQQFNLLHKYHARPESIDNDFYLNIGRLTQKVDESQLESISQVVRELLLESKPICLEIGHQQINFVRYWDVSLPLETTEVFNVFEITSDQLRRLYNNFSVDMGHISR